MQLDDIEAIEQVLAKATLLDFLVQVFVGSGDEANVHPNGLVSPQAFNFPLLQDAQEFNLSGWTHVPHLVQEKCPLVCAYKAPIPLADGPRISAALDAEQLCLQNGLWQGGAVNGDEGVFGAEGEAVQCASSQLFARTGFSSEEDGGGGGGNLEEAVIEGAEGGGLADKRFGAQHAQACAQGLVFSDEGLFFEGFFDSADKGVAFEGFGDEVISALSHGGHSCFHGGIGRHEDEFNVRAHGAASAQQLLAVDASHHQVTDDDADFGFQKPLEGFFALGGCKCLETFSLEYFADRVQVGLIVIDDEDSGRGEGVDVHG